MFNNILKMDDFYKTIWGMKHEDNIVPSKLRFLFNNCNILFKRGIDTECINSFFLKHLKNLQNILQIRDGAIVEVEYTTHSIFDVIDDERNDSVVRCCFDTTDDATTHQESNTSTILHEERNQETLLHEEYINALLSKNGSNPNANIFIMPKANARQFRKRFS